MRHGTITATGQIGGKLAAPAIRLGHTVKLLQVAVEAAVWLQCKTKDVYVISCESACMSHPWAGFLIPVSYTLQGCDDSTYDWTSAIRSTSTRIFFIQIQGSVVTLFPPSYKFFLVDYHAALEMGAQL